MNVDPPRLVPLAPGEDRPDALRSRPFAPVQAVIADGVAQLVPRVRDPALRGPLFHPDVLQPVYLLARPDSAEPLLILASILVHGEGTRKEAWYHVFTSYGDRDPTYADLAAVRAAMFRAGSVVVQVFPPAEEHVDLHPHTLHLWERLRPAHRLVPDLRTTEADGRRGV